MKHNPTGRLILLSGPSCVGKTPLRHALRRMHPDLMGRLHDIVLHNSRAPRPGEVDAVDYHFRTRGEIEALQRSSRFVVLDVRGDLQALDLEELADRLKETDALYEGNPYIARELQTRQSLSEFRRLGIFVSPLSREELVALRDSPEVSLPEWVADIMRRKLLRRARRHKGPLALPDLQEIERRCGSAYRELQAGHHFDHIIPNHDGEDSEHWDAFPLPLGDARKTVFAVAAILKGDTPDLAETWEPTLLP